MGKRSAWALALAVAMLIAGIAPLQAQPSFHAVLGMGEAPSSVFGNDATMVVGAWSFGDIDDGRGKVYLRGYTGIADFRMRIDVDCLRVDSSTGKAWIGGEVDQSQNGWPIDHGVLVVVDDNPGGTDQLVSVLGNPGGGPWPEAEWGYTVCETDVLGIPKNFSWGGVWVW